MGEKSKTSVEYFDLQKLVNKYHTLPIRPTRNIRWYFSSFKRFVVALEGNRHALGMLVIYLYMRIETAHRTVLYYEMLKHHKIYKDFANKFLDDLNLERPKFFETYEILAALVNRDSKIKVVSDDTRELLKGTRKIRNAIVHGNKTQPTRRQKEQAIIDLLEYAIRLKKEVSDISGFHPFRDLTGIFGAIRNDIDEESNKNKIKDIKTAIRNFKEKKAEAYKEKKAEEERQKK